MSLQKLKSKLDKLENEARGLKLLLDNFLNPPNRLPENITEYELWGIKEPRE